MNASASNMTDPGAIATIFFYVSVLGLSIFISGFIMNIIMIYLFISDKFFNQIIYRLMLVSAVSDIITTSSLIILYIQNYLPHVDYAQGSALCKFNFSISIVSYQISIYNLCLIAIDRYCIIIHPHLQSYKNYKYQIITVSEIINWLLSIASCIPLFLMFGSHPQEPKLCDIPHVDLSVSIYLIIMTIYSFVMPSTFIALIYYRLIRYQNNYIRPGLATDEEETLQRTKNRKITRKLLNITIGYILSTWPAFISIMIIAIKQQSILQIRNESIVLFIVQFLSIIGSNSITITVPLLYLKYDENIRARAWKLLRLQKVVSFMRCKTTVVTVRER